MIRIRAGGNVSVIVVLSSFYQRAQYVLGRDNQYHTGNKPVNGIEFRPFFPPEMGMFVNEKVHNKEETEGGIIAHEQYPYVFGVIKEVFFRIRGGGG